MQNTLMTMTDDERCKPINANNDGETANNKVSAATQATEWIILLYKDMVRPLVSACYNHLAMKHHCTDRRHRLQRVCVCVWWWSRDSRCPLWRHDDSVPHEAVDLMLRCAVIGQHFKHVRDTQEQLLAGFFSHHLHRNTACTHYMFHYVKIWSSNYFL